MKGFSLHCFHKCSLVIEPGVPRFKDPAFMFSREEPPVSWWEKQILPVWNGEGACYLLLRQTSPKWSLSHPHPSPAPTIASSQSVPCCQFLHILKILFLIYVYNCIDTCFLEPSILLLFFPIFFSSVGLCLFENPLYCTFSEISGSKIRYTSSTHSLNLECSTIPRQVGCSWFFFWQTPLSCVMDSSSLPTVHTRAGL